jgi:hypothetical protein
VSKKLIKANKKHDIHNDNQPWPKDKTHPSITKANTSLTHEEDVLVVEQIETAGTRQSTSSLSTHH